MNVVVSVSTDLSLSGHHQSVLVSVNTHLSLSLSTPICFGLVRRLVTTDLLSSVTISLLWSRSAPISRPLVPRLCRRLGGATYLSSSRSHSICCGLVQQRSVVVWSPPICRCVSQHSPVVASSPPDNSWEVTEPILDGR